MDVLAFRQAEWDLTRRLTDGLAHRNLDPPLELTDVLQIGVEAAPVAGAEILLERRDLVGYRIEDAGVLFAPRQPLLRTRSIAEQALESDTRIDFGRERLVGRTPGYGVGICAAIAPIAISKIADVLHPELNGRQDRVPAVLVRDQLVDRDAQRRAHRVSSRPDAGQKDGAARMVAARLFGGGHGLGQVQSGDENHPVTEWLERLGDKRKIEVGTFL